MEMQVKLAVLKGNLSEGRSSVHWIEELDPPPPSLSSWSRSYEVANPTSKNDTKKIINKEEFIDLKQPLNQNSPI